jgi:hypothetical protein
MLNGLEFTKRNDADPYGGYYIDSEVCFQHLIRIIDGMRIVVTNKVDIIVFNANY